MSADRPAKDIPDDVSPRLKSWKEAKVKDGRDLKSAALPAADRPSERIVVETLKLRGRERLEEPCDEIALCDIVNVVAAVNRTLAPTPYRVELGLDMDGWYLFSTEVTEIVPVRQVAQAAQVEGMEGKSGEEAGGAESAGTAEAAPAAKAAAATPKSRPKRHWTSSIYNAKVLSAIADGAEEYKGIADAIGEVPHRGGWSGRMEYRTVWAVVKQLRRKRYVQLLTSRPATVGITRAGLKALEKWAADASGAAAEAALAGAPLGREPTVSETPDVPPAAAEPAEPAPAAAEEAEKIPAAEETAGEGRDMEAEVMTLLLSRHDEIFTQREILTALGIYRHPELVPVKMLSQMCEKGSIERVKVQGRWYYGCAQAIEQIEKAEAAAAEEEEEEEEEGPAARPPGPPESAEPAEPERAEQAAPQPELEELEQAEPLPHPVCDVLGLVASGVPEVRQIIRRLGKIQVEGEERVLIFPEVTDMLRELSRRGLVAGWPCQVTEKGRAALKRKPRVEESPDDHG